MIREFSPTHSTDGFDFSRVWLCSSRSSFFRYGWDGLPPNHIGSGADRCAACHAEVAGIGDSIKSRMVSTFSKTIVEPVTQTQLCMKCHVDSMPSGALGNPHDLTGEDLQSLLDSVTTSPPTDLALTTTQCSQCHREHQGPDGQLQLITSAKCQACHRQQFESFTNGHPEFTNYPVSRPQRIAFDHRRHMDLHFAKKGKSFDCKVCHVDSQQTGIVGNVFRSTSFEVACAECHKEPIDSAASDGIVVLQLPSLDRGQLNRSGFDIGPWPTTASQMMDGVLSPLLESLLETTPEGQEILSKLPASRRFADVDLTSRSECENLVRMANQVRAIWNQWAAKGQPALVSWLESSSRLAASPVTSGGVASPSQGISSVRAWRPWVEQIASGIPPDILRSTSDRWFASPKPLQTQLPIRMPGQPVIPTSGRSLQVAQSPIDNEDDLLGGSNLLETTPKENVPEATASSGPLAFPPIKSWEHVKYGGWLIDEVRVALVYIPQGHADNWASRWLEWQTLASPNQSANDNVTRQCRQCHQLDSKQLRSALNAQATRTATETLSGKDAAFVASDWTRQVWRIEQRTNGTRELTRFDHSPHMTIPELRHCQTCHMMIPSGPTVFHGQEFQSLGKHQCVSCHTSQRSGTSAGESCTQCHNYHVTK
jgi:hypothetical protein